ncbi:MAG: TlpA family protein disulfide reductase [Roseinatronobacter sp.]|nr:MAG: TlpA family protein disulfide reductase [Roseinatronobacter sp.]
MTGITLGPIVLSVDRFAFIAGIAAFLLLVALARRDSRASIGLDGWASVLLVTGLVAGRLGHVLRNLHVYRDDPLSAVAFWQGGFDPVLAFAAAALVLAALALRGNGRASGVLLATGMAGALVWQSVLLVIPEPQFTLPQASFMALDGPPVTLAPGQPVVINLWATWCPPCRRELPMMMDLAEASPDVQVLFLNQAEFGPDVRQYLLQEGLGTDRVLLDQAADAMTLFETPGLPATLFFSSSGDLDYVHLGEISRAAFQSRLQSLR